MRMFDVQGIEILAPHHQLFQLSRQPANLPASVRVVFPIIVEGLALAD